jgi:hypothetical protein
MTAADLPDVFDAETLARFLGLSERALRKRRARSDWPFSPIAGFPAKGKSARYAKQHVLSVVNGHAVPMRRLKAVS